jgi:hypothetical protein
MKSLAPSDSDLSTLSLSEVMTMTGMARRRTSSCNCASISKPSITGMDRSSRMVSVSGCSCKRSSASRPLPALRKLHGIEESVISIISRFIITSSIARIFTIPTPLSNCPSP